MSALQIARSLRTQQRRFTAGSPPPPINFGKKTRKCPGAPKRPQRPKSPEPP